MPGGMRLIQNLAALALAACVAGCAGLPSLQGRTATSALTDTRGTRLGEAVESIASQHPGASGIHGLPDPRDAFAARALLAATAERSLDVQYYIWHKDQVGNLLFEALWQAAQRGVRVRLLLDDLNTSGLDPMLAALDAHPNIEVRLYNPLVQRDARAMNFFTDFARVNRRMHNKSFTADNEVSVVGGRNVGNEYFAAGSGVAFTDLDAMLIGPAVREVSKEFDLYWNSPSAFPASGLVGAPPADAAANLQATFDATHSDRESADYLDAVRATPLIGELLGKRLPLEWTTATVLYDDPAKTLDTSGRTDVLLFPELIRSFGRPDASLDLVSPYFVPGDDGTAALEALATRGVRVRVLTNSLAASDVKAVYAGYANRRQALLRAGVRLFELKPGIVGTVHDDKTNTSTSSSSALHAKTFAVDGSRMFIGSFNFDQRSARLNTEMGVVIASPALARQLNAYFDVDVPMVAYEVRLAPDGNALTWIERTAAGETRYDVDPGTTWLLRRQVDMLSILPIEWLL
jgi:putative cardiolipin synthase